MFLQLGAARAGNAAAATTAAAARRRFTAASCSTRRSRSTKNCNCVCASEGCVQNVHRPLQGVIYLYVISVIFDSQLLDSSQPGPVIWLPELEGETRD